MTDAIRYFPRDRGITKIALMRGDEELSRTLVVPMTLRLGRACLRMDGIGGVATPEQHRHKGYSRRVLEAAVGFMTAGDAVLSTLYGIPHFYPKYGYATLGPEYLIVPTSLEERATLPDGHSVRAATPGDLASIQRLYRQETAGGYGAVVREDDWWVWDEIARGLESGTNEVRVVERSGHVVGYAYLAASCWWMENLARSSPASLGIGEAFAADPLAADAVLAACRQWAAELGKTSLSLSIPPIGHVGAAATLQNTRVEAQHGDECEFMGRSVGLVALLRALIPELEARWRPIGASMPPFALTVVTDGERATISGSEDGIEIDAQRPGDVEVPLEPGTVARLVLGGFDPRVVLSRLDVPPAAAAVLTTFFPKHTPYIYPVDRF